MVANSGCWPPTRSVPLARWPPRQSYTRAHGADAMPNETRGASSDMQSQDCSIATPSPPASLTSRRWCAGMGAPAAAAAAAAATAPAPFRRMRQFAGFCACEKAYPGTRHHAQHLRETAALPSPRGQQPHAYALRRRARAACSQRPAPTSTNPACPTRSRCTMAGCSADSPEAMPRAMASASGNGTQFCAVRTSRAHQAGTRLWRADAAGRRPRGGVLLLRRRRAATAPRQPAAAAPAVIGAVPVCAGGCRN